MQIKWVRPDEIASQMWKMTTTNGGESIILKLGNGVNQIIYDSKAGFSVFSAKGTRPDTALLCREQRSYYLPGKAGLRQRQIAIRFLGTMSFPSYCKKSLILYRTKDFYMDRIL